MYVELVKVHDACSLELLMKESKYFQKLQEEIKQDEVYNGLQTIVIDIENTLVSQIEVKSKQELDNLSDLGNFMYDYIVV